jgi:N-acetylmuramoyl-L-alanine amidase
VRKWWAWAFLLFPALALSGATTQVNQELRATLTRDYELEIVVRPHAGDAWTRLAKRVTADAMLWKQLAAYNRTGDVLTPEQSIQVPFSLLRPELQREIVKTLFPNDGPASGGWRHVVVGERGIEGESLWKIAEWFTGDGANYSAIRKANPRQELSTRKGDVILIPNELLTAAFAAKRRAPETEGKNAASKTAEVRESADDPVERGSAHENAAETVEAVSVGVPSLTYERNAAEPYAVYRLQRGEALYSSVAIRFTGRVYAKDVGDVVGTIVKFNGIDDVSRIPVGYPVRIPMALLLPEYRPSDDPARIAVETSKRESARVARRTRAKNLSGVTVILDAGHGGRDVGTIHDGVVESRYVYDMVCRLKRILETRSGARVFVTTRSEAVGFEVADGDELEPPNDEVVLTTPRYKLDDSVVGVNLRWYLANSIFKRAIAKGVAREKVVFISMHADSLHPSLRGAMAYIPGQRYVTGSYRKSAQVYLTRAEVREMPVVRHSDEESLVAEGLSRELAESVIGAFESSGLKVHPFAPVRDNVVREGREWVPAVIRYNVVPTRMLLEVCNLGNRHDRALMTTKKYRAAVADAVYRGLVSFFDTRNSDAPVLASEARVSGR